MTAHHSFSAKLLAEFVGTFFLIAATLGAFVSTQAAGADLLIAALAPGLAIAIAVTSIGHVSGAHLNPAVTVAMLVFRRIDPREAVLYIVTQAVAAIAGSYAMMIGFDLRAREFEGSVPTLGSGLSAGSGLFLEAIATIFLVWTIFALAVDEDGAPRTHAGMSIGAAVAVGILMIGPATGGAMNPARWFGPALMTGSWDNALVWILGPTAGAIIAGAAYMYGIGPRISR